MQAKYTHKGDSIEYVPEADTPAGSIVVLGDELVGVAKTDIKANHPGTLFLAGRYEVAKGAPVAFARGKPVFWEDFGDGKVAPAGGARLGVAAADSGADEATVAVLLNL